MNKWDFLQQFVKVSSGLTPEPTPASATSLTPVPTSTAPVLSGGKPQTSGTGRSLADAVRLSKEARKDQPPKKSLGTITNDNLRKGGSPTPTPKGAEIGRAHV